MNRSTQNSIPLDYWRTRQDHGSYQGATRNNPNNLQSAFPPYLPAADPPNPVEVHDPWWFSRERATSRPVGIASFPNPRYFPDQTIFLANDATRNTYPRQRQVSPDASPSFQGRWNVQASPAEDSRLTQDEQKQALNKLKKEIYYPMPKRMAKRPNLYFREYDMNSSRETVKDNNEDGKRCAICLEDFEPKEVVTVTPCKHMFHEDCIIPWVKSQGRCPVCRFEICERLKQNAAPSGNTTTDDHFEIDLISVIRAMHGNLLLENMR